MKRLIILLGLVAFMGSCKCLIAQIPPQYIYVGENCEALLPDYLPMVEVSDNCGVKSITQEPVAGTVLNANNQQVFVTIRAVDVFDNIAEMTFSVKAVDTVPPVITPKEGFFVDNWMKIHAIYDMADRLLAEQEACFDATFPWDAIGIPEDIRPLDQYNKKVMNILTSPAHATTGYGGRVITYLSNNDSYIVK